MKKFWIGRGLMILFFGTIAVLLFGLLVMSLWNAILPVVLGVKAITFWQALGILLLSKILFGGFPGRRYDRNHGKVRWMEMRQKLAGMTPEEKEKFKAEWKNRCGTGWRMNSTANAPSSSGMPAE